MNIKDNLISIVIPCYYSEATIEDVVDEIENLFSNQVNYDYEIILVNDGSKDRTFDIIKGLAGENNNIVGVDFSQNFGQASAIMAGLHKVKGKYVVCMDDDGQMPIESLFDLIKELENGSDVAFGEYETIKQSWYRNWGSWVNVKMAEVFLGKPKKTAISSFWASKRYITDEMLKYDGAFPYLAGLFLRVTKNMSSVKVKHRERVSGSSGYTFFKLLNLWMNGFTAFSVKPLRFATFCGIFFAFVGFVFGIVTIIRKILNPQMLMGYASVLTLMLFIGGMLMMLLGILGEYIGRIYICINKAPQYVIKEIIDDREG